MKRAVAMVAVLLLTSAAGGCLGGTEENDPVGAASSSVGDEAVNGTQRWTRTGRTIVGWTAAVGSCCGSDDVGGACHDGGPRDCVPYVVELPSNATGLNVTVAGETVNRSRPGAGSMTATLQDPSRARSWSNETSGASPTFAVDDPAEGEWWVSLWPNGAVVNNYWTVIVEVEGVGGGSDAVAFEE